MIHEREKGMPGYTLAEYKEKVGQELGVSGWITIDQKKIDAFADITGDHSFIHVDVERARTTPFGTTIAHGFLTLSLLPAFQIDMGLLVPSDVEMGVNYGCNRVRFLSPVPSGARVRGRFRLASLEDKAPGVVQQTTECTVELEGADKPALVADWVVQYFIGR